MKKSIAMAAAMLISFSAVCMNASAEDTQVYVTISDDAKKLVLAQEPISVTDIDNDGKLTINDALYTTHENKFEGGAAAGYKTIEKEFGPMIDKLWGIENGGSYGYYVNDKFSGGLLDEIKDGDVLEAFVYPDPKDYNYFYSFFDAKKGEDTEPNKEVTLTLSYYTFNPDYSLKTNLLEGAKLTVNGKETDAVTDAEGKATLTLTEPGKNVISAVSDNVNIVPPTYVINVNGEVETTTTTTTTTSAVSTTSTTAAASTTASAKSNVKATTTASKGNSPKTGDSGAAVAVFALGAAVAVSFALRRRNEE